ncbi:phosphotransferase family protein [Spongiactinospora rosea]|uniref:phosphotransferase family protein n=1 Tax=Spongiactinospora rosea TaxID=2248750 RepID=UPI001313F5E4|nr:aminoglycoside phosphotransferase family protein [Spongiactinospora rosea]
MAVGQSTTHDLEFGDEVVIKRYRSWDRREPQREWTALTLLAEHAPGLAPAPIRADLNVSPPTVVMSRLPGHVLRGAPATVAQIDAVAAAFTRLHQAIPGPVLEAVEPAAWGPAAAVAKVRTWADKRPDLGHDADVRHAFQEGATWLATNAPDRLISDPLPPVLGLSDGNHANYLWDDGDRQVRLLDWEDSGRSDRAFEIAEFCEHTSRLDGTFDTEHLLAAVNVTEKEHRRIHDFRRLLALGWLLMLGPAGPFTARSPAGTLERQAQRVLHLLA